MVSGQSKQNGTCKGQLQGKGKQQESSFHSSTCTYTGSVQTSTSSKPHNGSINLLPMSLHRTVRSVQLFCTIVLPAQVTPAILWGPPTEETDVKDWIHTAAVHMSIHNPNKLVKTTGIGIQQSCRSKVNWTLVIPIPQAFSHQRVKTSTFHSNLVVK